MLNDLFSRLAQKVSVKSQPAGKTSDSVAALPPGASGVDGRAVLTPACPGPERIDQSCPDKPYATTLIVLDQNGNEVKRIQTAEDGRFQVELAPGNYILRPVSQTRFPRGTDTPVTIENGKLTAVEIRFDSGIR
jgi:hypothetical protein